jgi:hypothetical protein
LKTTQLSEGATMRLAWATLLAGLTIVWQVFTKK